MPTYGLTAGTDALRAAIRAEFANNDTSAQTIAVAVARRLKEAGFAIVPREPSREMWAAGGDAVVTTGHVHHDRVVSAVWVAMIAASAAPL